MYILGIIFPLLFIGCDSYNDKNSGEPSFRGAIVDSTSWYSDENNDVMFMTVDIPTPNGANCAPHFDKHATLRPCTLDDVNNDVNNKDAYRPLLHVKMQTNNFRTGRINALFRLRGNFTRTNAQKAYSIRLDSRRVLLNRERRFGLRKSQGDQSRMRNKLAFELFQPIPNITSVKTQFVDLQINGVEYGLFTHIEAIDEQYLVNRGWNRDDNIYNTVNFYFLNHHELAIDDKGQVVNEGLFSQVIEVKRGINHLKLKEMLVAVNSNMPIDQVISKYFNRDNYLTWFAVNLLLGNKDTLQHNFYLYNPRFSDTFYFLPWDYDGAWSSKTSLGKDQFGISAWWQPMLHKRFFSIQKNRDDIYLMAEKIRREYITDANIIEYVAANENSVRPYQSRFPDNTNNSDSSWSNASIELHRRIQDNIDMYKSVIGHPMPFHEFATYTNNKITLSWDTSVDLEGDQIVYDVNVSQDVDFLNTNSSVIDVSNINQTRYVQAIDLSPGVYYVKVTAREKSRFEHYQIAYDQVRVNGVTKFGVIMFEVK